MKRKGRGFPLEYYPGEILTETEARKNRKLVIVSVKKKVVAGVIVVYVVVKILTGLNKIEDQGQSQTLAFSTKQVIERNSSNDELVILRRNSTKAVQTSDLNYLNYDKMEGNSNQALILSQKIKSVNSNIDSVTTPTIVSKTLQIRAGDLSDWKFGPGSKARGAARGRSIGFGDPAAPVAVSVPNDRLCVVGLTIDGCDVKASLPGKNPVSLAVAVDPNEANVKRPAILTDTRNHLKPFRSEDL